MMPIPSTAYRSSNSPSSSSASAYTSRGGAGAVPFLTSSFFTPRPTSHSLPHNHTHGSYGQRYPSPFSSSSSNMNSKSFFLSSSHSLSDRLRARARLTNLAVALILGILGLSLLSNINHWLDQHQGWVKHNQITKGGIGSWSSGRKGPGSDDRVWPSGREEWYEAMKVRINGHTGGDDDRGGSGTVVDGENGGTHYLPVNSDITPSTAGSQLVADLNEMAKNPDLSSSDSFADGFSPLSPLLFSPTPPSIESTIERSPEIRGLSHLIIVAGHAIWTGSDPSNRDQDDDWILAPYQRGGSVKTFWKHIARGVENVLSDPDSLLIFSGGQTRQDSPQSTEAQSYLRLAVAADLLPGPRVFPRVTTEEFALDSFQNLLFSFARFKEVTGRWPEKVTVVGYEMKRARFETLHRAALRIPADRFRYIGIDDEGDTTVAYEGEYTYGYLPFSHDSYGCLPPLSLKRLSRNPFARYHSYHSSCPELAKLLEFCPPNNPSEGGGESDIYPYALPWEGRGASGSRGKKGGTAWKKDD